MLGKTYVSIYEIAKESNKRLENVIMQMWKGDVKDICRSLIVIYHSSRINNHFISENTFMNDVAINRTIRNDSFLLRGKIEILNIGALLLISVKVW